MSWNYDSLDNNINKKVTDNISATCSTIVTFHTATLQKLDIHQIYKSIFYDLPYNLHAY